MKKNMTVGFTKKSFENFCDALNHRMTNIENDVKWMKRIGYYLSGVITATGAVGLKLLLGA